MATFRKGNMLAHWKEADLLLITTNSTLKKNGALVMGAGIALTIRDRFKDVDKLLGRMISSVCGHLGLYGVITGDWLVDKKKKLGIFQVKKDWDGSADIDIIKYSTLRLMDIAEKHPTAVIFLNFPGIGNGKLPRETVLPIISTLPDNVVVWEYDEDCR